MAEKAYGFKVNDTVILTRKVIGYYGMGTFEPGTVLKISFIAPKVRIVNGEGSDRREMFVGFFVAGNFTDGTHTSERATIGTDFCNIKKTKGSVELSFQPDPRYHKGETA